MYLSRNLLYFRKKRNLSRQQAAQELSVRADLISGWEAGRLQPEAQLLPEIARLYHITIDDLFAHRPGAYLNHAHRLCSLFESTRTAEDYLLADSAFRQIQEQKALTAEDLLQWALLQQNMLEICMERALSLFRQIPALHTVQDDQITEQAHRQHMLFLIKLGRQTAELQEYLWKLQDQCQDPEEWLSVVSAFQESGRWEEALHWLHKARHRFPDYPFLCYWGGIIFQSQARWEDALVCWREALELDPDFTDASYACAECLEQLGDLPNAWKTWNSLAVRLESQGFTTEAAYPREQARRCREKLG